MQITCPSCGTVYSVPQAKLVGRAVKCARCGTQWMALRELPPVSARPPPEPEPEPPPPRVPLMIANPNPAPRPEPQWPFVTGTMPPPQPEPRSKLLLVAWVISAALIGAALASAFARRDEVMQAWPPSQRVYGLLGLR